ncbi:hypothetical protein GJ633_12830 [Halorubrum sp. CBA1125]|uniref:DUF7311 family protein n=1 Tax=Halorubrum sp. CBA1125 TaxID=2668072 RepID=UPI00135EEF02|nr:hypothetical protein [Halorubrum sp. CBA1125]MUW15424.1 hypothetical protein [Halorubrum sp. CBA1125]
MIRVVLTVAVAVALLGASMPALETARTATTVDRLDTEAERVERSIASLTAGSVAAAEPSLAARTTATVRVPTGLTAARIDRVALVETADDRSGRRGVALAYRLRGGPVQTVSVVPSVLAVDVDVVGDALALRTAGRSRLELRLVDDGGPTVRITRVG